MSPPVLDTSSLLALLWQEPGWEIVVDVLDRTGCRMSAVNIAEFVAKAGERQPDVGAINALTDELPIEIVPFDRVRTTSTGMLRDHTRHPGLSGDRACLSLARQEKTSVLTANRPRLELAGPLGLDPLRPASHFSISVNLGSGSR